MPPQYPGLGLDLRYHGQSVRDRSVYPLGMHTNCHGSNSELLLVREVAMMIVMDTLTDKPDWHRKVFDKKIARKWTDEALAIPSDRFHDEIVQKGLYGNDERDPKRLGTILDGGCLKYCIEELRSKAEYFNKTGIIPTLDATASVAKSDVLIKPDLHDALRASFDKLLSDQKENPDWHPGTNDMVLDLVHPSMHPLVYGRSRVIDEEVVGVEDAIDKWAGKGRVIPGFPQLDGPDFSYDGIGGSRVPASYWSTRYQWLPSNVKFLEDGGVRITSYINNLHPSRYRETYRTIERLIEATLPIWDQCLVQYAAWKRHDGPGRLAPRFPKPDDPSDENEENWNPPTKEGIELELDPDEDDDECFRQEMWEETRQAVQPEAPRFSPTDYSVKPGATLRERFKDSGLQVIVKMASIELTPDKPEYAGGGWHVEGQMNEHIVGTALYYLDSENVTPSRLKYRMQTSPYESDEWENIGQDQYHWMEQAYGTYLGTGSGQCLQYYGSVETKQGRLLAFPNVFHHQVSPFQLADPTKPGHRRFIALWLVDPLTRVISTANVPPQQQEWWTERVFSNLASEGVAAPATLAADLAHIIQENISPAANKDFEEAIGRLGNTKLPPELVNLVREDCQGAFPMTMEEAKEHRENLMTERSAFQGTTSSDWRNVSYNFCEH